jgi:hypothetical protein
LLLQFDVALFAEPGLGEEVECDVFDESGPVFVVVALCWVVFHQLVRHPAAFGSGLRVTGILGQEGDRHGSQPCLEVVPAGCGTVGPEHTGFTVGERNTTRTERPRISFYVLRAIIRAMPCMTILVN